MPAFTTYGGNLALAFLLTGGVVVRPVTWFVALHIGDPGAAGTANEITAAIDANYVRKSVMFDTPADKQTLNTLATAWTAAAGTTGYTITHVSIKDALSGGNTLLAVPKPVVTPVVGNQVVTFNIGEIVAQAL